MNPYVRQCHMDSSEIAQEANLTGKKALTMYLPAPALSLFTFTFLRVFTSSLAKSLLSMCSIAWKKRAFLWPYLMKKK